MFRYFEDLRNERGKSKAESNKEMDAEAKK